MADETTLVVDVESVARRLGLDPVTLTDPQRVTLSDAIADVQSDVRAYLGAPIVPVTVYKDFPSYTHAAHWEEWLSQYIEARDITYTAQSDGTVRVQCTHGYDAKNDPDMEPVRKYVRTGATLQPSAVALWRTGATVEQQRRRKSASTDGQSISYEYLGPDGRTTTDAAKDPGAVPDLSTLDYWRVAGRRVVQGKGYGSDPLPTFEGVYGSWRPW